MAANDPDKAPIGGEDPRLASIDERLAEVRRAEEQRTRPADQPGFTGKGSAQGQRVLSALLGAPLGAALIGWLIDSWAETMPLFTIVMLFLGFGAAISQVVRISKEKAE